MLSEERKFRPQLPNAEPLLSISVIKNLRPGIGNGDLLIGSRIRQSLGQRGNYRIIIDQSIRVSSPSLIYGTLLSTNFFIGHFFFATSSTTTSTIYQGLFCEGFFYFRIWHRLKVSSETLHLQ